jgi:hypothetical protein
MPPLPSTVPPPSPRIPIDAIPLDGTDTLASAASCVDRTAPASHLRLASYRNGILRVSGWATDKGCTGTGGRRSIAGSVLRVIVSVALMHHQDCSFLAPNGKLQTAAVCQHTLSLVAKGARRFSLKVRARLPNGRYTVRVQAIDDAGNLEKARLLTLRMVNGTLRGGVS